MPAAVYVTMTYDEFTSNTIIQDCVKDKQPQDCRFDLANIGRQIRWLQ